VMGRATQGVRLIRINEGDAIAAVTKVEVEVEEEEAMTDDGTVISADENPGETPAANDAAENPEN
jgi:DNA gyrase subunit A